MKPTRSRTDRVDQRLECYLHQFVPQSILRRGCAAFLVIMAAFIFFENIGPLSAVSRGQ